MLSIRTAKAEEDIKAKPFSAQLYESIPVQSKPSCPTPIIPRFLTDSCMVSDGIIGQLESGFVKYANPPVYRHNREEVSHSAASFPMP